jgi:guanine deaminase
MKVFRGTFLDTPHSPFTGGHVRADSDLALVVDNGVIVAREPYEPSVHTDVVDLSQGLVLPGFVDTHVHFPQVRAIGGLGMPLLDWLEKCALPEEARLADASYAASVAAEFVSGLARAGTTTALVFGSHFASAVDALFAEATRVGLRVTSGLVLSDRVLREDLFTTPERAYDEGLELAKRWHSQGRTRYAVTPRFTL